MRKYFLPLLLCVCCCHANAQTSDEKMLKLLADDILRNSAAYENLRVICKEVGPRLSGSANAAKAVRLAAEMMEKAGADTVYLQPCLVTHWERGKKESGYVQLPGEKFMLSLTAIGNSVGTGKNGVSAPVVEVTSMQQLHKLGAAVKGKIVFFNIAMNPTYIETYKAYSESGIGRRAGPSQAAKYGAVGVMIRSLASNIDNYPHTGTLSYNDSFPKIPAIAISTADAEKLSKALAMSGSLPAYFKTDCKMYEKALSYNVIGELRGTEMPKEIITVGGHLDSWDLAEGASDDGTGCMQSIEVIRTIKKMIGHPKRTVRAVLFMNEENGGGGGKAYLDSARSKRENHIFALESDAGGFTPRSFNLDMTAAQVAKVKSWSPLFLPYGIYDIGAGGSGSDIEPLKEIGTALAGFEPDSQRYFDLHHAATDVFEKVSKRELDLGTVNITALIWLISNYGIN